MAFIDDFKTRFPEIDTAVVDIYFPLNENTYQCYFNKAYIESDVGNCDNEAIMQLMAHLITIDNSGTDSALKDTSSLGEDGVNVTYNTFAPTSNNDAFFMSTKYGQRYLQLRSHVGGGCFV
jgi:hypothetical protein